MNELWTRRGLTSLAKKMELFNRRVSEMLDETDKKLQMMSDFEPSGRIADVDFLLNPAIIPEARRGPLVVERMAPFFQAVLWLHRTDPQGNWIMNRFAWKGQFFELESSECQLPAQALPELSPLKVQKTSASQLLKSLNLEFIFLGELAQAFLLRPTPSDAFVLVSETPGPWAADLLEHSLRLINLSYTN